MSPNTPRETILLMDDDAQVTALALEVLRQQGHIVLEAASGEEAVFRQAYFGTGISFNSVVGAPTGGL